jgi:hypothetical protein
MADASPKLSKRKILQVAQLREAKIIEQFLNVLAKEKNKLNGMTRLLGCVVERYGEMDFDMSDLEAMDPGRMFVREQDGKWMVRIREDSSQAIEISIVPENVPDEALDLEAMARDGVTEVKFHDA